MKSLKKLIIIFIITVFFVAVFQISGIKQLKNNEVSTEKDIVQDNDNISDDRLAEGTMVNIIATGDNFMHESVIESGKQQDGTYNYDYIFEGIKKYIDNSDVAILNQASVIGGNNLGVSGYPDFNAPEEICDAVSVAGFDVVLMASNRINSMGMDAVKNCIDIWKNHAPQINILGIKKQEQDADYITMTVNGVKIAMFNCTYGVNTPISSEDIYAVNFLCEADEAGSISENTISSKLLGQIETASETNDYVIVFPCWGNEYEYLPSDTQKQFAKQMADAGADLIIGTHPHYLQPVEWIETDNGNRTLCYYSLGNLISSQNYAGSMLGGLASVTLKVKDGVLVIDEENTGLIPVVTQYTYDGNGDNADMVGVIPYSEYTDELAAAHGISARAGISFSKSELQYILDTYIDSRFIKE